MKTLGDHLRKRRLDLNLLQRHIADRLGVDDTTVCNWESGRTAPQLRFIPRILAFLGYDPYVPSPQALGERIIAARRRLGLTQKGLAGLLDIDPGTVSRWERGKSLPSKNLLRRLSAYLTFHLSDVVEPEEQPGQQPRASCGERLRQVSLNRDIRHT